MSYNDFFMRKIGDVDFLIDKKNIMEFDGILKKMGLIASILIEKIS